MADSKTTVDELKKPIRDLVEERDWDKYHTPKNLSMALATEAAELMELFLWVDGAESREVLEKRREEVEHEIADIASYVLYFCSMYNIDLSEALEKKREIIIKRYPVEKCKGRSEKYSEL
jgi:dCTP diphosphatase